MSDLKDSSNKATLYHELSKVVLEEVVDLRYKSVTLFQRIIILEDLLTETLQKLRKDINREGLSKKELNMFKNKIKRDLNKLKAKHDLVVKKLEVKEALLIRCTDHGNLPELTGDE